MEEKTITLSAEDAWLLATAGKTLLVNFVLEGGFEALERHSAVLLGGAIDKTLKKLVNVGFEGINKADEVVIRVQMEELA